MKAAGIWRRLFAHILDYFIILLIVVAFYFIIALFSQPYNIYAYSSCYNHSTNIPIFLLCYS